MPSKDHRATRFNVIATRCRSIGPGRDRLRSFLFLLLLFTNVVEVEFYELRVYGVLRSSFTSRAAAAARAALTRQADLISGKN
jgi:hypothetical protein